MNNTQQRIKIETHLGRWLKWTH